MIAGVLTVLLAIVSLTAKKKTKTGEQRTEARPTVMQKRLPVKAEMAQPSKINWRMIETKWPGKMDSLIIEPGTIDNEMVKKFLEIVGLKESQKTGESSGMIMYGDGKNRSAYFDVWNNKFSYTEAINNREQLEDKEGPMISGWENRISKAMNLDGAKIQIVSREYKRIINPRWETTTEEKAEATEIRANYYWGDYPLLGFEGEPIRLIMAKNGKLLKMEVETMGKVTSKGETKLMAEEKLRQKGADEVWVWRVETETEGETVGEVTVTKISLGYVYNDEGVVGTYWLGEGNGIIGEKPTKITIITPANE